MADINETDARIFIESVTHYFEQITGHAAEIRTAYLANDKLPHFEYTGLINFSGQFKGSVYFSATSMMAARMLLAMRESDTSNNNLLDIVGEVANTIAGNARRHFGAGLEISTPTTTFGNGFNLTTPTRARPFAIELQWQHSEAVVVVDLENNT